MQDLPLELKGEVKPQISKQFICTSNKMIKHLIWLNPSFVIDTFFILDCVEFRAEVLKFRILV